jgi:hypothetical protein
VWKTRLAVAEQLRATTVVKAAWRPERCDRALDLEVISKQRAE